ncbi:MAG TPA: hypothetical protein VF581_07825 [Flavobacterium sp.]|jgi:hypothetical protein
MEKQFYSRVKSILKTEEAALQSICNTEHLTPTQLEPVHTEKLFKWNLIDGVKAKGAVSFPKSEVTEKEAKEAAKLALVTFEGNLKPDHDEEYYSFSKVRG